jgi:hypothetical protein
MQWKKPEEEMPKDQQRVAVIIKNECGKMRVAIAEHISAHSVKSEDYLDDGCENCDIEEYDEKEDCYYVLENWFESNLCEEINWVLSYQVLAWAKIEIPEEYKIATQNTIEGVAVQQATAKGMQAQTTAPATV